MHVILCGNLGNKQVKKVIKMLSENSISHELNNSKYVMDMLYESADYANNELNAFVICDGLTQHVSSVSELISKIGI